MLGGHITTQAYLITKTEIYKAAVFCTNQLHTIERRWTSVTGAACVMLTLTRTPDGNMFKMLA